MSIFKDTLVVGLVFILSRYCVFIDLTAASPAVLYTTLSTV